ncbi:MAG: NTP transferase domain-containing protein, partial [Euzebyales bacterium]|nr:NTP transferase domain-containing protein [Euzebyales bacterium]
MRIVILAAGLGSRLGLPRPKPLARLAGGQTILRRAADLLTAVFGEGRLCVVVGFKAELVMAEVPDCSFVVNPDYAVTNTAPSLALALAATGDAPVLWLNGDVVFSADVLSNVMDGVRAGASFVAVNTAEVGEEEIKYTVDGQGAIRLLSKTVTDGLGEAVGINYVTAAEKPALLAHLRACADDDYFERGMETAVAAGELRLLPLDLRDHDCIEVDFAEDLQRARDAVAS